MVVINKMDIKVPLAVKKMSKDERKKYDAQEKYCKENSIPFFTRMGKCYSCNKSIFGENIGLIKASTKLITGCPNCGHSFCE